MAILAGARWGSWSVCVVLAKAAMLGAQFAANELPARPIAETDLERCLVDQELPIGLLSRVAPAVQWEKTPTFMVHTML